MGLEATLLTVSVVVYRPDRCLLDRTLDASLRRLGAHSSGSGARLYLVDNGGMPDTESTVLPDVSVLRGQGNVGYGRGHNLAIDRVDSQYHLVLNPDIELDADALTQALTFMDAHPEVRLLSPLIVEEDGSLQYLCRRYPAVFDLFIRGFLPRSLRNPFTNRLARPARPRNRAAHGQFTSRFVLYSRCARVAASKLAGCGSCRHRRLVSHGREEDELTSRYTQAGGNTPMIRKPASSAW
jgi:GT2 family glycosyltransferase